MEKEKLKLGDLISEKKNNKSEKNSIITINETLKEMEAIKLENEIKSKSEELENRIKNIFEFTNFFKRNKEKKTFKEKLKVRVVKTTKNALLIPLFVAPVKIVYSLVKQSFPERKIDSYKESIERNGLSNEDMKKRQKTHIFLRNFFLIAALVDVIFTLFSNDKVSYVIYSLSIFTLIMISLHHDLRVWQIENKRLCFFGEYLIRRFITRK